MQQPGSRSGKHPDPPEYIATYRTQEKASREKICVENTGRLDYELGSVATGKDYSVASQNRRLLTSSTAAHYIDQHPKPACFKLDQ